MPPLPSSSSSSLSLAVRLLRSTHCVHVWVFFLSFFHFFPSSFAGSRSRSLFNVKIRSLFLIIPIGKMCTHMLLNASISFHLVVHRTYIKTFLGNECVWERERGKEMKKKPKNEHTFFSQYAKRQSLKNKQNPMINGGMPMNRSSHPENRNKETRKKVKHAPLVLVVVENILITEPVPVSVCMGKHTRLLCWLFFQFSSSISWCIHKKRTNSTNWPLNELQIN